MLTKTLPDPTIIAKATTYRSSSPLPSVGEGQGEGARPVTLAPHQDSEVPSTRRPTKPLTASEAPARGESAERATALSAGGTGVSPDTMLAGGRVGTDAPRLQPTNESRGRRNSDTDRESP